MVRAQELASFLARNHVETYVLGARRHTVSQVGAVDPKVYREWVIPRIEYYNVSEWRLRWISAILYGGCIPFFGRTLIDASHVDLYRYYERARRLIEGRNVTNVIVSTPPHSLQLLGPMLKRFYGSRVKVFADFRDPWLMRPRYRGSRRYMERIRQIQKQILDIADGVFISTRPMASEFGVSESLPENMHVVENGYSSAGVAAPPRDVASAVGSARDRGKVVFGFFGAGGAGKRKDGRSLQYLFDALEDDSNLADRVAIICQGPFSGRRKIPSSLEVHCFPTVSNEVARGSMSICDVGIVSYDGVEDADYVLGGKLYDYVAAGLAVWMLTPRKARAYCEFAARTGKPIISDIYDPDSIRTAAWMLVDEADRGVLPQRSFSEYEKRECSREFQFSKILTLLRDPDSRDGKFRDSEYRRP